MAEVALSSAELPERMPREVQHAEDVAAPEVAALMAKVAGSASRLGEDGYLPKPPLDLPKASRWAFLRLSLKGQKLRSSQPVE